jgi:ribosomal protein S18 acetylase RimI-like enzyme
MSSNINKSYSFRAAEKNDINDMINIIGDFYDTYQINNTPLNKNNAPWIWMSDTSLTFEVMLIDNIICGFFIARHIDKNSHLHSLFIKKNYRGNGFGEILLVEHWKNAISNNPSLQTLTLHIHENNSIALNLYLKFNYKKISQDPLLIKKNNGFGKWAQNCQEKDQWPLKKGVDLYGITLLNTQIYI